MSNEAVPPSAIDIVEHTDHSTRSKSLEDTYWYYLLTEGERPKSVFAFTEYAKVSEQTFYTIAANFDHLESIYWERLVTETIQVLQADEDYLSYSTEDKFSAFFFTFFVHIQNHRSRLVKFFPYFPQGCSTLKGMKSKFTEFAKELINQGIADGSIADRKKVSDLYPNIIFEQLRGIIEFHRKDNSPEFQDTDALIEKTIRLGADAAQNGALDSAIDLGRFLLRRITT